MTTIVFIFVFREREREYETRSPFMLGWRTRHSIFVPFFFYSPPGVVLREREKALEEDGRFLAVTIGGRRGKDGRVALPNPVQSSRTAVLQTPLLRSRRQLPPLLQDHPDIDRRGLLAPPVLLILFLLLLRYLSWWVSQGRTSFSWFQQKKKKKESQVFQVSLDRELRVLGWG